MLNFRYKNFPTGFNVTSQVFKRFARSVCIALIAGMGMAHAAPPVITASVRWPGNKAQFFLDDGTYMRFDMRENEVEPGYPKPVNNKTWPGLGPYAMQMTSMINWENDKVYFFLDNGTFLRYDIKEDSVDPGYPKRINDSTWPGMGQVFARRRMP